MKERHVCRNCNIHEYATKCINKMCAKCCDKNGCKRHEHTLEIKTTRTYGMNENDDMNESYEITNNDEYEEVIDAVRKSLLNKNIPKEIINIVLDYFDDRLQCCDCDNRYVDKYVDNEGEYRYCYECNTIICDDCVKCIEIRCTTECCWYCMHGTCFNTTLHYCDKCYEKVADKCCVCSEIIDYDNMISHSYNNKLQCTFCENIFCNNCYKLEHIHSQYPYKNTCTFCE